jgi:5'-3' exoribonuclease 2
MVTAMGKGVDPGEAKPAWDSNAITPGTPFMDLLASSLRYWVVKKLNTDPGWKNVCPIDDGRTCANGNA